MVKRYGTSSMPCDSGIYVLHKDYEALERERDALRASSLPETPSPEMIRAALAVQWPAIYRDGLYMECDGPRTREETNRRVEVIRQQYRAMLNAMAKETQQ